MPPEKDFAPPATPAELLAPLERFGVKLGLERMERLLDALGAPQRAGRSVLVAGTNGKGSTAAFLASVLEAAGVETGLYTSPHLEEVEERVRVGGRAVAPAVLARALTRALAASRRELGDPPTYFEAVTAAAFLCLRAADVGCSVLEVGLGGRLDATNCTDPVVSVVTGIGLDHTRELGEGLDSIAREKAGIFRAETPALIWSDRDLAGKTLAAEAARLGARLEVVEAAVSWTPEPRGSALDGERGRLETPTGKYDLALGLRGVHQVRNAALAVRVAERFCEGLGRSLEPAAVESGIRSCRWPGRLELVPLPEGRRVLLDAAHNPQGIESLRGFLDRVDEPQYLLFGVLEEKDGDAMLRALGAGFDRALLTRPPGARAREPKSLAVPSGLETEIEPQWERALERALEAGPGLLVVCGSIYLVGAVRSRLHELFGRPARAVDLDVTGRSQAAS
ncbi:MAG: folylpolyglutamate synthase/dihydrofolate synthase family protein [Thermoanaerobaculia bacterium]